MKLRPREGIIVREEEGEAFLFDPETGQLSLLNATGLEAWRLLDGTRDQASVARALAASYPDAEEAVIAADVARFVEDLVRAGFVEASHDLGGGACGPSGGGALDAAGPNEPAARGRQENGEGGGDS